MKLKEYQKIVNKNIKQENKIFNALISFLIGGLIGLLGQVFVTILENKFYMPLSECYMYLMILLVTISSVLTGLGIFDEIVSFCKCGLIIPTTGFAHSMTSAAMDNNEEGLIKGIGSNIFKLTGSIILYGITIAFFLALLKGVIMWH